jgi:hypothetical protein
VLGLDGCQKYYIEKRTMFPHHHHHHHHHRQDELIREEIREQQLENAILAAEFASLSSRPVVYAAPPQPVVYAAAPVYGQPMYAQPAQPVYAAVPGQPVYAATTN